MSDRPTLDMLRSQVHKERHREIGNWLARKVARPSAVYGTWLSIRLGLSANQVTLIALIAGLAGALAIGLGTRSGFIAGVLLSHLAFWLDHVDGQVARWRGTSTLDGVYLDYLLHHALNLALGFALGYGLTARGGDSRWAIAGFAIAAGWLGLSLHNDCRYKAFFQRLKRETRSYRIDAGSGGRPCPALPWPRHGIGMLTWPAYKICEPHVVLIGLSGLAIIAAVSPMLWVRTWQLSAIFMAVMSPMLAVAQASRAVKRGAVEAEFRAWFQD